MTTWNAINDQAPKYIQQLMKMRQQQNHNLRSNSKVHQTRTGMKNKLSYLQHKDYGMPFQKM